jgi:hypothetical protein
MSILTPRRARMHAAALVAGLWGVTLVNFATPGLGTLNGHVKGEDWAHFWAVGRVAARHDARGLYDIDALQAEFERAAPGAAAPTFVPVYGPQLALALAPFGVLPYGPSLALWWISGALVYWLCCRVAWRQYRALGPPRDLLLFAAAYPGFWQLFIHGQTTWLALACFTVIWRSLRQGRPAAAGIALGLLAYKPQLGIAIVLFLLVRRSWTVLLVAAATVLAQVAVCWLWFGVDVFRVYGAVLAALPRISPLLEPKVFQLVSLRGFFLLLGAPSTWANAASLVAGAAVIAAVLHGRARRSFDLSFALLLVATVLVGGHVSVYDLVLLAPAFVVIAGEHLGDAPPPRGLWPLVYAAFLLALTGPLAAITRVQLASPVLIALVMVVRWRGTWPRRNRPRAS